LVGSIRKRKVMDVRGFQLLEFNARLVAEDHWLEVHTKPGRGPDDEWVEFLGGIKGEKQPHLHVGINKDTTLRFAKKRGVLKSVSQRVMNADTQDTLDATEDVWGDAPFSIGLRLNSYKPARVVWVSDLRLVRNDLTAGPYI